MLARHRGALMPRRMRPLSRLRLLRRIPQQLQMLLHCIAAVEVLRPGLLAKQACLLKCSLRLKQLHQLSHALPVGLCHLSSPTCHPSPDIPPPNLYSRSVPTTIPCIRQVFVPPTVTCCRIHSASCAITSPLLGQILYPSCPKIAARVLYRRSTLHALC